MAQVSKYLRSTTLGFIHYCPACDEAHHYQTKSAERPNWTFNGNVERPS